ncbi:MAG: DMT family transporter, partial [Pontibacterium sp.]
MLLIASECLLVITGMFVKYLSDDLPTAQIVFCRNLISLAFIMPLAFRHGLNGVKTSIFHIHLFRGVIGVTAMFCLYYGWSHLPLAQAALLKQTAPFFMPIVAAFWLGETTSKRIKFSIILGFAGVGVILQPGEGSIEIALVIALFGAFCGATVKVAVRRMSVSESPETIALYFTIIAALVSAIPGISAWQPITNEQMILLGLMAGVSTTAQILLNKAYALAPVGQLGPFTYASVAFAALFGWLLWN